MTLVWPWWLLGLAPVLAAALLALLRPARRLIVVGSLELWRQAVEALPPSARRGSRRVTGSWLCLLAGAAAAVLAASRPVFHAGKPARQVAVAICPSAVLANPPGLEALGRAAFTLLGRLGPHDQVQLLAPETAAPAAWLSPAEAARRLEQYLRPENFTARDCPAPSAAGQAQHVYRFVPAGTAAAEGPGITVIHVPTQAAPFTIDALGAEDLPGGMTQVFVAARNNTDSPASLAATVRPVWLEAPGPRIGDGVTGTPAVIPPGGRGGLVLVLPPAPAYAVALSGPGGPAEGPGAAACIVAATTAAAKVAMLGPDVAAVRRFVAIHPGLALVGSAEQADMVICNGVAAPPDKPALIIDPPQAPTGWRIGPDVGPLVLADADLAADDPVMRHVDLAGVAVRHVAPWIAGGSPTQMVLAACRHDAIVLRTADEATAEQPSPRRVFVAFDLNEDNTNFPLDRSFVIFLANATRWLWPAEGGAEGGGVASPAAIFPSRQGWRHLPADLAGGDWREADGYAGAGWYRASAEALPIAVSLLGLRPAPTGRSPTEQAAAAPLPAPLPTGRPVECWPALALAATACWLAGWALRAR